MQIYSETKQYRDSLSNGYMQTKAMTDRKSAVWKHNDKVSVVESVMLSGHPNQKSFEDNPDKRWWRWYTIGSMGFRRNKAGNIVIYNCRRSPDGRRANNFQHNNMNVPMEFLNDGEGPLADAFRDAMWETFRITSQEDFYPMMREYNLYTHKLIPTNIRGAFKLDNWESYTSYIFGKTRQKRLVAAVQNTEPYVVALAHQARGLISDDTLTKFVENTHFDDELCEQFKPHAPLIRRFIKEMPVSTRERIFSRGIDFLDTQRIGLISRHLQVRNLYIWNQRVSEKLEGVGSWSGAVSEVWGKRFDDVNYLSSL